jgi:type II restriction/modification system DNA methylase subunit YeeA
VSLVAFGRKDHLGLAHLNGCAVDGIEPDLTASAEGLRFGAAEKLAENAHTSFQGSKKVGSFDIPYHVAKNWLREPNPNNCSNAKVLFPYCNGIDITRRSRDVWIVDFGLTLSVDNASLYELPFEHILNVVKPERDENRRDTRRKNWWRHGDGQPAMRAAVSRLRRFLVTPEVARHRIFAWLPQPVLADSKIMVIAREDDATFGILQSRIHELWSLRQGGRHGVGNDPRYSPSKTFDTFPFPEGLTPVDTAGPTETLDSGVILPGVPPERRAAALTIAEAAHRLNQLRENWLNPPEWVDRVPEVVPGYPDRIIAKPEHAAELKKRTLTNLYNQRPTWLDNAHKSLDAAVAAAYGWQDYTPDMPDAEILTRLLALNLSRSKCA